MTTPTNITLAIITMAIGRGRESFATEGRDRAVGEGKGKERPLHGGMAKGAK